MHLNPSCLAFSTVLTLTAIQCVASAVEPQPPNIVLIYADDIGYGDVGCYGAMKVSTPNIDRLAAEGLRFTDAHCAASVCTPSRYSLLTGEYAFRKSGTGIASGIRGLLIDTDRDTLPSMLQRAGYKTGIVGKWHLGLGTEPTDYNQPIKPGPNDVGFDYAWIMPATGDRVPCVWVENDHVVNLDPTDPIKINFRVKRGTPESFLMGVPRIGQQIGGKSALWDDENLSTKIVEKSCEFLDRHQAEHFFLEVSTHNIHVPRVANPKFVGKSKCGPRGDTIVELDWIVGEVLQKLHSLRLADETLVIFTSDNGGILDNNGPDKVHGVGDPDATHGHRPNGILRGYKYDVWEGGTRVPMIVRWPGKVIPGESNALVSQIDFLASFAALTNQTIADDQAPDSENELAALIGDDSVGRAALIEQRTGDLFGFRQGHWKLLPTGGGRKGAQPTLYDLSNDLGETVDLAEKQPARVAAMMADFAALVATPVGRKNPKDLSESIRHIEASDDVVRVGLGMLKRDVSLVSCGCFDEPSAESTVYWQGKPSGQEIEVRRIGEHGRDRLFDRFVLLDASGKQLSMARYVDRLDKLTAPDHLAPWPKSIKGLQAISNWDDAAELGVAHATLNIPITPLLVDDSQSISNVPDELRYVVDGKAYFFNQSRVEKIDRDVKAATDLGINTIAIILATARDRSGANNSLVHPDADLKGTPTGIVSVNTKTAEGERQYRAVMGFLGERYSRQDKKYGNIGGYIIGNEIQSHWFWHNLGEQDPEQVIRQYADQLRLSYYAIRQHTQSPKVFVSMDHHWCAFHQTNAKRAMPGKTLLDGLASDIRERGDFEWHVAFHPYPENLFKPAFWNDSSATYAFDTPKITFKNTEVLVAYLDREELRYRDKRRRVILSEQGFHAAKSDRGEQLQAAAFAASYVRSSAIEGIDAYLLHRYVDSRGEGGLNFGLRRIDAQRQPSEKRLIYDAFAAAGTSEQDQAFAFALPVIGIASWSEMLPQPAPFPMKQADPSPN